MQYMKQPISLTHTLHTLLSTGSLSSDMEKTVLKATRPDNDPAKRKHVQLLVGAVQHFPLYIDPDIPASLQREGPFWLLLHKLWRRMTERDWRSVMKSLYVLHR
jgi:hypothetical protein